MLPKAATILLVLGTGLYAADPAAGTWKLNLAKSKFSPGPTSQSATITYEETPDGIKRTGETVAADGSKTSFEYTARYDGKEYPVTGSDLYDGISFKKIDDRTVTATLKKGGKVVSTARRMVSRDGKLLTITVTGTNAQGQKVRNVLVYDKT